MTRSSSWLDVSDGYGDDLLFEHLDLGLEPGERARGRGRERQWQVDAARPAGRAAPAPVRHRAGGDDRAGRLLRPAWGRPAGRRPRARAGRRSHPAARLDRRRAAGAPVVRHGRAVGARAPAVGRGAAPAPARPRPPPGPERPAPGRADQRPRPRHAPRPRGPARRVAGDAGGGQPRPCVPRAHGRGRRGPGPARPQRRPPCPGRAGAGWLRGVRGGPPGRPDQRPGRSGDAAPRPRPPRRARTRRSAGAIGVRRGARRPRCGS